MKNRPDATLVTRRGDRPGTLHHRIESSLADMVPGAVLEIPCADLDTKYEIAGRALLAGRRIIQPFEPWSHGHFRILIEKTVPLAADGRTAYRRAGHELGLRPHRRPRRPA